MNDELKKKITKNSMQKYMERHQTLCVTLDKTEDADIIAWASKQPNRSKAIREVLRKEAQSEKLF